MHARRLSIAIPIAAALLAGHAGAQTKLPDLSTARAFSCLERWPGHRPGETVYVGYTIERQGDEGFYAGGGHFTVQAGNREVRGRGAVFAIPPEVARRFLAALSAVPVAAPAAGTEPLDSNSAVMDLTVQADGVTVEFLLASRDARMRPWQVTVRGAGPERRLVSDSDAVWRAFLMVQPHLKRDVLESLRRGGDGGGPAGPERLIPDAASEFAVSLAMDDVSCSSRPCQLRHRGHWSRGRLPRGPS
jgi:hypothetical protein